MDPAQIKDKSVLPLPEKKENGDVADPQNSQLSSELEHITKEMYLKNSELAKTNKTLSILQKLNSIILSSVTDPKQVSTQVADLVASEAEFQMVSIYVHKKDDGLVNIANSGGEAVARAQFLVKKKFPLDMISIQNSNNIMIKAITSRKVQISEDFSELLVPQFSHEEANLISETLSIRSTFIYPLIAREEVIGAITISTNEPFTSVSEHEEALMNRLASVIGIALDSSMLYEEIQLANDQLKQLDLLKDEFVSLASHELRTPMTVIKSYVWMIVNGRTGEINEKQKIFLDKVYQSTERLIHLVNDMLNISRIESGRLTINKEKGDLDALAKNVVSEMLPRAKELNINLEYQGLNRPLIASFDSDKIKEVIINLIGNSLKFTQPNGQITVSAKEDEASYTISVVDNGRGIRQEDMNKLFKKFNMVGNGHLAKDIGQGTGLGLYLSKSLVELHGGKIWVGSDGENKGATFSFSLPKSSS